ncbi:MAG: hypothetical protein PHX13_12660, partial [Thiovulaceae bacterium]|nr:hypothetical protein [Sulfurimonadaceae bacterium]
LEGSLLISLKGKRGDVRFVKRYGISLTEDVGNILLLLSYILKNNLEDTTILFNGKEKLPLMSETIEEPESKVIL